mgnify:CR=1 FL=1
MRNIKLLIQYEGTNYSGWQTQANALAIQEIIEKAIRKVTGEKVNIIGSGRTDGKVHALGQVANFYSNSKIPADRFKYALNINMPDDIKIIESVEVDNQFHSRFDAIKKRYKYLIYNNPMPNPIYRNFAYHIERKLDMEEMQKSLIYFIGEHDFKGFMGPRTQVTNTIRRIYNIELREINDMVHITIEGNSFLRHMIRIIVGTLVYIGLGKIQRKDLPEIIKSKDRTIAGPTAPPQGLFLERVFYGNKINMNSIK